MRLPLTGSWLDVLAAPLPFTSINGHSMDRMVRQLSANGADMAGNSFSVRRGSIRFAGLPVAARYVKRADDLKQA
jgi:hypothetical protein